MPNPKFILDIASIGVASELFLNDMLVFRDPQGRGRTLSTFYNPLAVDGVNTVRLRATGFGSDPNSVRSFSVEVKDGGQQQVYSFRNRAVEAGQVVQDTGQFSLPFPQGKWRWLSAPNIKMDTEMRRAIWSEVETVHAALAGRDLPRVMAAFALKNQELAQAYGVPRGQVESSLQDTLQAAFADPSWGMQPIIVTNSIFEPLAAQRAMAVHAIDGRCILRSLRYGDEDVLEIGLVFARLDERWQIVR
jgi:hypothetical protein